MEKPIDVGAVDDFNMYRDVPEKKTTPPVAIDDFLKSVESPSSPLQASESDADKNEKVTLSDGDVDAFNAIVGSIKSDEEDKKERARAANRRAYAKKRKAQMKDVPKKVVKKASKKSTKKVVKKAPLKMPKYISDGMPAVHLVMKQHLNNRYQDGCDVAPTIVMGNNAYNKPSQKNAFERLAVEQAKFADWGVTPEWFIITRDDVSICDPQLMERLNGLQEYTHAAGPMGVTVIRRSGKFYRPDSASDVKGSVIQGNLENSEWNFMKAADYDNAPAFQVATITAGMLAIRGRTFMDIDFSYMAENSVRGFQHFMGDICMEVNKRNCKVAVIKTLIRQEDVLSRYVEEDDFKRDHQAFIKKWARYFPIRF